MDKINIGLNKFTFLLVFIYFLVGIGVTYAYFAFSYENSTVITGNVVAVDADLTVELVVGTNEKLVPMMDGALSNALNAVGTTNGACIDSLGNLSCQVYKITLTNNATRLQHLVGSIELYPKEGTDSAYSNLKWQELSSTTQVKDGSIVNGMEESILVSGLTMESKETKTWYVGVWLSEIDDDQKDIDKGEFQGTVTFEVNEDIVEGTTGKLPTSFIDKVMGANPINDASLQFNTTATESGTNGIYVRNGTENDSYPIYYYRGAVDNNLIFAGFCWKIVRTTETGGLKLIYNGTPTYEERYEQINTLNNNNYKTTTVTDFLFDDSTSTWTSTNTTDRSTGTIEFTVDTAGDYFMTYTVSSEEDYDEAVVYKNDTELGTYSGDKSSTVNLIGLTTSDVIKVTYSKDSYSYGSSGSDNFSFSLGLGVGEKTTVGPLCNNTGDATQIGTKAFNSSTNSPAKVGYMYGDVYAYTSKSSLDSDTNKYVYGNDVSYQDGTYTLIDTTSGAWSSVYNGGLNNYHYTCFTTGTTCTSVNYIYHTSSSYAYYITLSNGVNIETALSNMLDKNTNSSTIKGNKTTSGTLDYWYYNNIEQKGYKDYIEDTVWCNDRSIYKLNGWNPNGGDTTKFLYFGGYERAYETFTPDLTCARDIDKFTVDEKNGNGDLDYPVGLLTSDEIMLAGGFRGEGDSSYYLYSGQDYWAGSPYHIYRNSAFGFYVYSSGILNGYYVTVANGVRPSLSLKRGFTIADGGDGTVEKPYVVE